MKVTADNLKSAILSRIREVCERKAEAYIEPVHALVIRDDLYLSVCCACTFDEFRALVDELVATTAAAGAYLALDLHRFKAPTQKHVTF